MLSIMSGPLPGHANQPSPRKPSRPPPRPDTGPIPLDVEPNIAQTPGRRAADPFCPFCERPLRPDATICSGCGYNRTTGSRRTPVVAEDPDKGKLKYQPNPCRNCGYDVNGVVNPTCPECNEPIRRSGLSLIPAKSEVSRASYRKAFIGIAVGLVAIVLCAGIHETPRALLGTAMCWPISIVGYAMAKFFWDGLDEPWSLLSVRALAALSVTVAAAILLLPLTPMSGFSPRAHLGPLMLIVIAAVAVLDSACEEDLDDSIAYAIPFVVIGSFGPNFLASLVM